MIDQAAYEGDLIQEIRSEYGTERTASEGASEATGTLQSKLRSSISKSRQPSRAAKGSKRSPARSKRGSTRTARTIKGSDSGKRRTGTKIDKGDSSINGDSRSVDDAIQHSGVEHAEPETEREEEKPAKPAGLDARPNAREQQIRQEQAEQQAAAAAQQQASRQKKNFFSWLRADHRGKASSEKESARSRPFSEREAEEIRPALLAALLDYFKYADELIYATNKAHQHVTIFSSIDDEDAGVLVDAWLARARQSAKSASHVVFMVNKHMELRVGIILIPRFYEMFRVYVDNGISVR
jgi:hypothetical protein